ncbi:MAG TPA: hypothetical protein VEU30_00690 [Thermoanaerobaculia bacterium]|nr:hypothetical protein [Thermoanaerobaculia bacterium]
MRKLALLILLVVFALPVIASDHADPMTPPLRILGKGPAPEAIITDLFAYPKGDDLIVIFNVMRALSAPPPYPNLEKYEYQIYFDLHTKVTEDDVADMHRYNGTIPHPADLRPDVTIQLQLNADTTVRKQQYTGLRNPDGIRLYTGVRDDPFIFPRFFGTNVVAMVMAIPFSSFPAEQQDFILWGISKTIRGNKQIDHVGRSLRTMLPRFDFINKIPPAQHVDEIRKRQNAGGITRFLMRVAQPVFAIRAYDFQPDVMIYTRRRPVGFPNGRLLTDDVADLTCRNGDCLLWELSFSQKWPRATKNDKEFLEEWPYLAEPWPPKMQ